MDNYQFSIQKLEVCLKDICCEKELIEQIKECYDKKDFQGQIHLLRQHRCSTLERLHDEQKKIDCIDYLIYTINKKENI